MKQLFHVERDNGEKITFDFCSERGKVAIHGAQRDHPYSLQPDMYQPMCERCSFKKQHTCSITQSLLPICGVFHEIKSTEIVEIKKPLSQETELVSRVSSVSCLYSLYYAASMFSHCPVWSRHRWIWPYLDHNFQNGSEAFTHIAPFLVRNYLMGNLSADKDSFLEEFSESVNNFIPFNNRLIEELQRHMAEDSNANALISFLSRFEFLLVKLPDKMEELRLEICSNFAEADKHFISSEAQSSHF